MSSMSCPTNSESIEVASKTMASLKLDSCSCAKGEKCQCIAGNMPDKKKGTEFPYFWRRTRNNVFTKATKVRKKAGKTCQVLQPSLLTYIVAPGAHSEPSESRDGPQLECVTRTDASETAEPSSESFHVGLDCNVASSEVLPDLTCLSLQSDKSNGVNEGRPSVQAHESTESSKIDGLNWNSTLMNCTLKGRTSGKGRGRGVQRSPKWKSRFRGGMHRSKRLPPILEDSEITDSQNSIYAVPASPNLNCSQQALLENSNGRWNTEPAMESVDDVTIDELASYLDVFVYIPKKMSAMAEMMYT